MKKYDVLSYGTIGLDYILSVPYFPTPERGVHTKMEEEYLGGKASNTAVFLGYWGLKVVLSGHVIGNDAVGDRLFEVLNQQKNVSTEYMERQDGLQSMYCRILVNRDGERAIIGVSVDETPQTIVTSEMISSIDLLTMDLYGGAERISAAKMAVEAGLDVVVGDLRDVEHPVLPFTTVAIASADELRRDYPGAKMHELAKRIQASGAQHVMITDGANSVLCVNSGGDVSSVQPPTVDVVDSTGAGDAFRAGVVYGLLEGEPLESCCALATAIGSLNVTQMGAATNLPDIESVRRLANTLSRK